MPRLLLISGGGTPDEYIKQIYEFLDGTGVKNVLFVPYARILTEKYANATKDAFDQYVKDKKHGDSNTISLKIIPEKFAKEEVEKAEALFIGGGNTFLLLKKLQEEKIMDTIKDKVEKGMPYIGLSAGTNVATVSIKTTNDMPIVYPESFDALKLVPFNINPHFKMYRWKQDTNKVKENQISRIMEFLALKDSPPVLGLCEGCNLLIKDKKATLTGNQFATLFWRNPDGVVGKRDLNCKEDLSDLLKPTQQ